MKRRESPRFWPSSQDQSRAPDFCAAASPLGKQKCGRCGKTHLFRALDDVWKRSPPFHTQTMVHSTVLL